MYEGTCKQRRGGGEGLWLWRAGGPGGVWCNAMGRVNSPPHCGWLSLHRCQLPLCSSIWWLCCGCGGDAAGFAQLQAKWLQLGKVAGRLMRPLLLWPLLLA